jgi:hypothetical protein
MYYLQPCSDPGADGKCGTADDGDADARSPTLMRMRMDSSGALISEAVVDGVEQLQFEYASPASISPSKAATPFQPASKADFTTVTQVRVSLVARSTTRDTAVPHSGSFAVSGHCAYSISAAGAVTYDTPTTKDDNTCNKAPDSNYGDKPQQYARTINTQVVVLRNRVRG